MTVDYVTRREFEVLASRVDWLDEHGTRGVGALQIQVTDLVKDIAKLEKGQEDHALMHQQEQRDRRSSRRWLIAGVLIPTMSVIGTGAGVIVTFLITRH